ncbi:hypothetical protein C8R47DRAFT_54781 [Mycena vitilis]|nr:hypothetical protein C8R47DRAFT_54781 [Mycena vitilis]
MEFVLGRLIVKWTTAFEHEAHCVVNRARWPGAENWHRTTTTIVFRPCLLDKLAADGHIGRRFFRITIEQKLQPVAQSTDPDELAAAFKEIVECHHLLYEEANVLHGAISPNNLMF